MIEVNEINAEDEWADKCLKFYEDYDAGVIKNKTFAEENNYMDFHNNKFTDPYFNFEHKKQYSSFFDYCCELFEAIKDNGINTPILIDSNNNLLGGHKRFAICKVLKIKTISVEVKEKNE